MDRVRPESRSVSGALLRLASGGYARHLKVVGGRAWCGSCEEWFEPEDLVVDVRVMVLPEGQREPTTVYGLRCSSCGAGAAWVVGSDEQELEFLARLNHLDGSSSVIER